MYLDPCQLVDVGSNHLANSWSWTQLQVQGVPTQEQSLSPALLFKQLTTEFETNLMNYMDILIIVKPCTTEYSYQSNIMLLTIIISTAGPPVHVYPQQLFSECLKMAEQHFKHMLQLGIIYPSWKQLDFAVHMQLD